MRELTIEEKNLIIEDSEAWNLNRKLSKHEEVSFSNGPKEFCDLFMDKELKDLDLSNIVFNDLSFFNTTFGPNVNLTNTTFNWCSFKYGLFEKATVNQAYFNNCSMNYISESVFKICFFNNCYFPDDIQDSKFETISLTNCFCRNLSFLYSELYCSSITNSNFDRVHIKMSTIKNCTIQNVSACRGEFKLSKFYKNYLKLVQADDYFKPICCIEKDNKVV